MGTGRHILFPLDKFRLAVPNVFKAKLSLLAVCLSLIYTVYRLEKSVHFLIKVSVGKKKIKIFPKISNYSCGKLDVRW